MNCCEMKVNIFFLVRFFFYFFFKKDLFLHKMNPFGTWSGKPLPYGILFY